MRPSIKKKYNIKAYFRLKNDVFIIAGEPQQRLNLTADWDNAAAKAKSPYTLEKWEASTREIDWLDVTVMKIPGSKRLHFKPHFKPSSLGVPLSDRSAQSIAVHTGWPKAEMDRL